MQHLYVAGYMSGEGFKGIPDDASVSPLVYVHGVTSCISEWLGKAFYFDSYFLQLLWGWGGWKVKKHWKSIWYDPFDRNMNICDFITRRGGDRWTDRKWKISSFIADFVRHELINEGMITADFMWFHDDFKWFHRNAPSLHLYCAFTAPLLIEVGQLLSTLSIW